MFPGINSRQARQMMKRMGMKQVDIPAVEVIIRTPDRVIVINNPSVAKVNMMGQESWQITGEAVERETEDKPAEISNDDVKTVSEQAGVSEEEARKALEENNGDLAAAIMSIKNASQ